MRLSKVLSSLAFLLCAIGVFSASYAYFKAQELDKAAARLTFYRSTVEAELRHFAHLPFLLSQDPIVRETLAGGDPARLNQRLARFAQSAGIDAIYLMDKDGLTISASNARLAHSFVGQNYRFRPYFQAALNGELGEFYGVGATTGVPGYFFAMAVGTTQDENRGVIAIKVDLSALQNNWLASGERIILSNADGVVLLASDPAWRYSTLAPLNTVQRDRIIETRQFGAEPLNALNWSPHLQRQTATLDDTRFLYLHTADLPNSWSLHFFTPDDQAIARAWLVTGIFVILGGIVVIVNQLRHTRQIGAALSRSEQKEVALRQANARLAIEIDERRAAEKNLQKTQTELERAGRLAALGQLASSVTHELGQPIAAMHNQLAAAEMTEGTTPLTKKMQGLVVRMENITKQLKFFSRKGRDQFGTLDLREILDAALELVEPNISQVGAKLDVQPCNQPLVCHGNRMRLEQVATNILRNALDAVEGIPDKHIAVTMGSDGTDVWFAVADSGHGLGNYSLDDLKEPFATTRESGKGMGLGMTISAGIVADHGGAISAETRPEGGAAFRISLPQLTQEIAS